MLWLSLFLVGLGIIFSFFGDVMLSLLVVMLLRYASGSYLLTSIAEDAEERRGKSRDSLFFLFLNFSGILVEPLMNRLR